jgi:hypothetical protein
MRRIRPSAAEDLAQQNRNAALLILADVKRSGGEGSLAVRWARTILHTHLCYIASLMACLPKQSQRQIIEQLAEPRNLNPKDLKDLKLD